MAQTGGRQGEGNKGVLLVARLETKLIAMVICYAVTCLPVMNLSINPVNNIERQNADGSQCSVAVIGQGEWGSNTLNAIDGQTADIPLWWAFVHAISKGMTAPYRRLEPCVGLRNDI